MGTVIDPKELMEQTCEQYRSLASARHMEVCVLTAAVVSRTLHLHIAVRSEYLTNELIDGLLSNCERVAWMVIGAEFEGFVYVPRGWKPIDRSGQPGQADEAAPEGVLSPNQDDEPVRESQPSPPIEDAGKRSGRGRRKGSPSQA